MGFDLHLTMTHSKGCDQCHTQFDCKHLANGKKLNNGRHLLLFYIVQLHSLILKTYTSIKISILCHLEAEILMEMGFYIADVLKMQYDGISVMKTARFFV